MTKAPPSKRIRPMAQSSLMSLKPKRAKTPKSTVNSTLCRISTVIIPPFSSLYTGIKIEFHFISHANVLLVLLLLTSGLSTISDSTSTERELYPIVRFLSTHILSKNWNSPQLCLLSIQMLPLSASSHYLLFAVIFLYNDALTF